MRQGGGMGVPGMGQGDAPTGAWQPATPKSLRQANASSNPAAFGRGAGAPGATPPAGTNPNQGYPYPTFHNPYYAAHALQHHPSQMQHHHGAAHNPYMGGMLGVAGRPGVPGGSAGPSSSWQPFHSTSPQHFGVTNYPQGPNPQLQQQLAQRQQQPSPPPTAAQMPTIQPPTHVPVQPREKKISVITDRYGNVVDLTADFAKMNQRRSLNQPYVGAKIRRGKSATKKQPKKKEEVGAAAVAQQNDEEKAAHKKQEEEEAARILHEEEVKRNETEQLALKKAEKTKARLAVEQARKDAEEQARRREALAPTTTTSSLQEARTATTVSQRTDPPRLGGLRPGGPHVYTKDDLLRYRELEFCLRRPASLPEITIVKGVARAKRTKDKPIRRTKSSLTDSERAKEEES